MTVLDTIFIPKLDKRFPFFTEKIWTNNEGDLNWLVILSKDDEYWWRSRDEHEWKKNILSETREDTETALEEWTLIWEKPSPSSISRWEQIAEEV